MTAILVIVGDRLRLSAVQSDLSPLGFTTLPARDTEEAASLLSKRPDIAIVAASSFPPDSELWQWLAPEPSGKIMPMILITPESLLPNWESNKNIDDVIVDPYRKAELHYRVRRLLRALDKMESGGTIVRGDLTIDDSGYEVHVSGRRVDLTYREYQLLRYLAANEGKVVTRETLLNKVWGYDYFGGDRTVDVHVRRLRSKLEDSRHVFIHTVRNVGYRFRGQGGDEDDACQVNDSLEAPDASRENSGRA